MSTGVGGKNKDWGFPQQEPGLGITQGVYVCVHVWTSVLGVFCFYKDVKLLGGVV